MLTKSIKECNLKIVISSTLEFKNNTTNFGSMNKYIYAKYLIYSCVLTSI